MILPGVNIGNRVIIGAGAVVAKNIPDNSVAVGVPVRAIKSINEYLEETQRKSLHFGHLSGREKERELKKYFNIQ